VYEASGDLEFLREILKVGSALGVEDEVVLSSLRFLWGWEGSLGSVYYIIVNTGWLDWKGKKYCSLRWVLLGI
jgi:hypothetical protein